MIEFRLKQIYLLLIFFFGSGCDIEEKVKAGIDAAFIEISGKVTHIGSNVGGALVLLVEGTEISDGLELSNGSISGEKGNYKIFS